MQQLATLDRYFLEGVSLRSIQASRNSVLPFTCHARSDRSPHPIAPTTTAPTKNRPTSPYRTPGTASRTTPPPTTRGSSINDRVGAHDDRRPCRRNTNTDTNNSKDSVVHTGSVSTYFYRSFGGSRNVVRAWRDGWPIPYYGMDVVHPITPTLTAPYGQGWPSKRTGIEATNRFVRHWQVGSAADFGSELRHAASHEQANAGPRKPKTRPSTSIGQDGRVEPCGSRIIVIWPRCRD